MARIKWIIVMSILILIALFWHHCPYPPYGSMPFSIEPYTVLDSIIGSHGISVRDGDTVYMEKGRELTLDKHYLITGFDDMKAVEQKIDSLLPHLVDSTILNRGETRLYFFKKTHRCNNTYGRSDRWYTEFDSGNDCLFLCYFIGTRYPTLSIISIFKKWCEHGQETTRYATIWNRDYLSKDSTYLTDYTLDKVRPEDRNPGMEQLFERIIAQAKQKMKERGDEVKEGYKRYHVR